MDLAPPPLISSVIEGVLDVTTVYVITLETRTITRAPTICSACQGSSTQDAQPVKTRPVATIRPFLATKEREAQEQEIGSPKTSEKEEFPEVLGKEEIVATILKEEKEDCSEVLCNEWKSNDVYLLESEDKRCYIENKEEKRKGKPFSIRKEENQSVQSEDTDDRIREQKKEERVYSKDIAEKSILFNKRKNKEGGDNKDDQESVWIETTAEKKSQSHPVEERGDKERDHSADTKNNDKEIQQKEDNENNCGENSASNESNNIIIERSNSCNLHSLDSLGELRQKSGVSKPLKPKQNPYLESPAPKDTLKSPTDEKPTGQEREDPCTSHRQKIKEVNGKRRSENKMECQNGNCHESEGCSEDFGSDLPNNHKETSITECLDEFLEGLQLTHLGPYLRVLGCTCVRDLTLLEQPELDAIQLISRRRLLKRLQSINLHHEAPPADCSLEEWLTWYGLSHITGFLSAVGVHSVGDLSYLKEEDLQLLKPVTRRRILCCYRK